MTKIFPSSNVAGKYWSQHGFIHVKFDRWVHDHDQRTLPTVTRGLRYRQHCHFLLLPPSSGHTQNTRAHVLGCISTAVRMHTHFMWVFSSCFFLVVIYQSCALTTFSFLQGHNRCLQYVTLMTFLPAQLVHMLWRCKCVVTQIHETVL